MQNVGIAATSTNILVQVGVAYIVHICSQDLITVMAFKAKGKVPPLVNGIAARPGDIQVAIQPVACLIVVGAVLIGPVVMIKMVLPGIMAGKTANFVAGYIKAIICVVTSYVGRVYTKSISRPQPNSIGHDTTLIIV
jgi:hypothetical protein